MAGGGRLPPCWLSGSGVLGGSGGGSIRVGGGPACFDDEDGRGCSSGLVMDIKSDPEPSQYCDGVGADTVR